jgi:predicted MFS family arabinose efflux permease
MAATEVNEAAHRDGWRVVWTAFVVAVCGWGVGFYGPSVYLPTLHQTRGWPISTISAAITAHYLVSALLITALPDAYRRFGVGRVTIAGALLTGAGAIAWANAQEPWQRVPALLLSGAGWSAMSGAALNAMVAPWFEHDRPKAISTAFNGASVGGILFVPLWTALIAGVGLPGAALAVCIATVAVVCPLAWRFLRHGPAVAPAKASGQAPLPRRALLRQPGFVTISIAFALGLFAQIGLFAHLIARLEPDFGSGLAAAAISLITLCAVVGRTLLGWLLGKRDRRLAAAANFLMQAVGAGLLAFGDGAVPLAAGCVLFGLGVGNLVSLPPLIAQCEFRPADVGTVVALVTAINQAVFAFAPAVFGALRDFTGNYVVAFLTAAAAQIVAAGVIVYGRRFS